MLSLMSIADLTTLDRLALFQFFAACENAIGTMSPMSVTDAKACSDFISEISSCVDKVHDIENRFGEVAISQTMLSLMNTKLDQAYVATATLQPRDSTA